MAAKRLFSQAAFYWFPVIGWAILIFSLSSVPGEKLPAWEIPHLDKAIHAVEFGVLALLLYRAFCFSIPHRNTFFYWGSSFLIAFLYAVSDEWHQHFVPGRIVSAYDLLADTVGILLFLYLIKKFQKKVSVDFSI